jgi:hypothetical protein
LRRLRAFVIFGPLLAACCFLLPACQGPAAQAVAIRSGDLLFQETDGHALGEAIKAVTGGIDGAKFTHVGIAEVAGAEVRVVEAAGKGVRVTPLKDFLARSADDQGRPKVVVGRLKAAYAGAVPGAMERSRELLGRPYNDTFVLGNGKYYCSQLVYDVYRDPASGQPLFELAPMTFCPPGSKEPLKAWREYFAGKGMEIPEGQPGCNPGGLSRSAKIEIVGAFGRPTGWTESVYRRYSAESRSRVQE